MLAGYDATHEAADRARRGEGPTLLECLTFRMKGHAQHDNQAYVPSDVLEDWAARDPIARYERVLEARGVASRDDVDAMVERIDREVDEAVRLAEADPMPDPASAAEGVFDGSVAPRAAWLAAIS